jgi:hypothetical protein
MKEDGRRMMEKNKIEAALFELLKNANERYGDEVEHIWFYDGDICPCCNKRNIDALNMGSESALSLNAYMYHELKTLIGYFLCSQCITDLLVSTVQQKSKYEKLEQKLKDVYHDHLKSSAS